MKIILACENKKIEKYFNEEKNDNLILKKVQYREGIIEILKKDNNINLIFLYEKLPGEISVEELIKKIKIINKEIKIIFFLEKENIIKKDTLKKLGITEIYNIKKTNKFKFLKDNKIIESNKKLINKKDKIKNIFKKIFKNNKIKKILNILFNFIFDNKFYLKNKIKKYIKSNKKIKNKIISICGKPKSGKTTITFLLIIYLIEKNKKILLINFDKKIKNNKNFKITILEKNKVNNNYEKNNHYKININNNLTIINNFDKTLIEKKRKYLKIKIKNFLKENEKKYDYILFDIGYIPNKIIKDEIINISNKKILVFRKNLLGIKDIIKKAKNKNNKKNNTDKSLHIIQNFYDYKSFSNLIIQNIFYKLNNVNKISYQKNLINLEEKFFSNQKTELNNSVKKIIIKIIK